MMVCPLPPQLQSPSGVQELVSGRPPRLNELNQQEMTCGHPRPYNAQAIVSLLLAQRETTVVTESGGRMAMPVAQPLPHGLSSGHPYCPLHLERSLGGGRGRCTSRHLRPRLLLGLWLHHHH
jgi:hypothetical protein